MDIRPFAVDVPQATLDDLHARLGRTRWPDEVEDAGWDYGASLAYLQALVEHWRTRFDWRGQERAMNALPHFRADVDGLGIHFITVPIGVALSTEAVQRVPRERAARSYADIRRWTEFPRGGHFFAAEAPRLLAEELRAFFRPFDQTT